MADTWHSHTRRIRIFIISPGDTCRHGQDPGFFYFSSFDPRFLSVLLGPGAHGHHCTLTRQCLKQEGRRRGEEGFLPRLLSLLLGKIHLPGAAICSCFLGYGSHNSCLYHSLGKGSRDPMVGLAQL